MLSRRRERQLAESMRRRRLEEEEYEHASASEEEAEEHQNRRRNLGFMKYAEENRKSSQTMDRTREHARQIAMALSKEGGGSDTSPFAADFGSAFGGDPFASTNNNNFGFTDETTESTTHTDFDFFGNRDPFASVGGSGGGPAAGNMMADFMSDPGPTVVRRSAWNASPITKKAPPSRTRTPQRSLQPQQQAQLPQTPQRPVQQTQQHQHPKSRSVATTPNRPTGVSAEDISVESSRHSTPGGGGGGGGGSVNNNNSSSAAARRRMRTNMRQKEPTMTTTPQRAAQLSVTSSSSYHHQQQQHHQSTPPQKSAPTTPQTAPPRQPQLQLRSTPQHPQQQQHRSTPQQPQQQQRSAPRISTPQPQQQVPMVSKGGPTAKSRNDHQRQQRQEPDPTDHLFDIHKTSGFSFDAFGLDGAEMQKRVHAAMDEIGWEDDEFAPQNWSSDDNHSSSHHQHQQNLLHLESPEKISERSSLTDSVAETGNVNMFKEQPGYHKPRKVVRPLDNLFDHQQQHHQPQHHNHRRQLSAASATIEGKASVRTESTSATTVTAAGDVGKLRSRWETQTTNPPVVTAVVREPPQKLRQSHIARIQNQLGEEILSPEKLLQYAATQESADLPDTSFFDCDEASAHLSAVMEPVVPQSSRSEGGAAIRRTAIPAILTSFDKPKSDVAGSPYERRKARQSPSSGRDFETQAMRLVQNHSPQSRNTSPAGNAPKPSPQNDVRAQIKRRVSENRKKSMSSPLITPPKASTPEFSDVRNQLRPVVRSTPPSMEVDRRHAPAQSSYQQHPAQEKHGHSEQYTLQRRSPQGQSHSTQSAVTSYSTQRDRPMFSAAASDYSPAKPTTPEQQQQHRSYANSFQQNVRQQPQQSLAPPQHDVRGQIEHRVAAAANRTKGEPPGHVEESSSSEDMTSSRSTNARSVHRNDVKHASPKQPYRQEYVANGPSPQSQQTGRSSSRQESRFDNADTSPPAKAQQRQSPSASPPPSREYTDDPGFDMPTDSDDTDADLMHSVSLAKAAANAAISRSLMIRQIPVPSVHTVASSVGRSPGDGRFNVEAVSDVVTDMATDDSFAKTPKATMMMLNAFLAGRESIASGEGVPSTPKPGPESSTHPADGSNALRSMANGGLPALKEDPQYEKYFKMLKIGMPMDVVKHAMTRDGVDPSVMDGDHNKPVGIPLKEDPEYSKYFKMLSIGLPMEAIKHSMARDGLDPSVMDQDHDMPAKGKKSHVEQPKEQDSHRRARLHWKTLRKVTSNSLWAQIDKETNFNIQIDEDEFQELFQAEKTVSTRHDAARSSTSKRTSSVCVIDSKRANNGGIILARLKMSHDDMADAVDRIDEGAMTAEQIEQIIEYLPSKEERKALESYMLEGGQDAAEKFDALCECEKFMVSMMTVKHAKRKVSAILFKLQFETCIRDIQKEAQLIEKACSELRNSSRLRQLFGIVLTFGNRLNTAGNGKRKAGAFTLDSLLKLREAKAFDKKTTFLHYIVMIVRRNNESLLDFKRDIPTVFEGDKIFWDQCIADLEQVENQLENVRKIALYQAHQSNPFRLRRRNKKEDPEESLTDDDLEMTLEEELETLRATHIGVFTLSAIKYVSALRENVESTKIMFARLLEYFGEEESAIQPHELFSTMVAFSRDFEKAKEEVFERENKRLREERILEKQRTPVKTPPQNSMPQQRSPMLRSSNLQPNMGSVLKQLKASATAPLRRTNSDGMDDRPVQAPTRPPEGSRQADRHAEASMSHLPATPPQQPRESPQPTRYASPFREDEHIQSKPPATPTSPRSPHASTSLTMSAMRGKTRLRRHITTTPPSTAMTKPQQQPQESHPYASPIMPSRFDSPTNRRLRASAAAPIDAGAEQPVSPRSPRREPLPSVAVPSSSSSPFSYGEAQLSPRSSSALRMKRRMQHRVRVRNGAV